MKIDSEDLKDWLNYEITQLSNNRYDMFTSSYINAHSQTLKYIRELETKINNQSLKDAGYF